MYVRVIPNLDIFTMIFLLLGPLLPKVFAGYMCKRYCTDSEKRDTHTHAQTCYFLPLISLALRPSRHPSQRQTSGIGVERPCVSTNDVLTRVVSIERFFPHEAWESQCADFLICLPAVSRRRKKSISHLAFHESNISRKKNEKKNARVQFSVSRNVSFCV